MEPVGENVLFLWREYCVDIGFIAVFT